MGAEIPWSQSFVWILRAPAYILHSNMSWKQVEYACISHHGGWTTNSITACNNKTIKTSNNKFPTSHATKMVNETIQRRIRSRNAITKQPQTCSKKKDRATKEHAIKQANDKCNNKGKQHQCNEENRQDKSSRKSYKKTHQTTTNKQPEHRAQPRNYQMIRNRTCNNRLLHKIQPINATTYMQQRNLTMKSKKNQTAHPSPS